MDAFVFDTLGAFYTFARIRMILNRIFNTMHVMVYFYVVVLVPLLFAPLRTEVDKTIPFTKSISSCSGAFDRIPQTPSADGVEEE